MNTQIKRVLISDWRKPKGKELITLELKYEKLLLET
ncbi:MAG: hypothetical protein ACJATI_004913 [Halioglobus sp.]|jgi:hypothetical protein